MCRKNESANSRRIAGGDRAHDQLNILIIIIIIIIMQIYNTPYIIHACRHSVVTQCTTDNSRGRMF